VQNKEQESVGKRQQLEQAAQVLNGRCAVFLFNGSVSGAQITGTLGSHDGDGNN